MRVLVTRGVEDAGALCTALRSAGHDPVVVPLSVRSAVAVDWARVPDADWALFTSSAAVGPAIEGMSKRVPAKIAAVGRATAEACRALGASPTITGGGTGPATVASMGDLRGARVLFPSAEDVTPGTLDALSSAGAEVIRVVCYRNAPPDGVFDALRAAWPWDAVTLMASSAAERYSALSSAAGVGGGSRVVAIGASTAAAARAAGLVVDAVADEPSIAGMITAIGRLPRAASGRDGE